MSGVNESCHCFFFLKTKIGMPLCTVMVLVSHLAKAICVLGASWRCHSLLHLGWEVTWDPQQGGCCVKTHKARVPGGKTEQNLSLPCSPLPPCCVAVLAFPSLYLLFLKKVLDIHSQLPLKVPSPSQECTTLAGALMMKSTSVQ